MRLIRIVTVGLLLGCIACGGGTERNKSAASDGGAGAALSGGGGPYDAAAGAVVGGAPEGGVGGGVATDPAPVKACVTHCEVLAYWLPRALCEDWGDRGRSEFCATNVEGASECADQCRRVYESVSDDCAEALPPAIACVAPTYADLAPAPAGPCWLADCRRELHNLTSACYGLKQSLEDARQIWRTSAVDSYDLRYQDADGRSVEVAVRAGKVSLVTPANATPWTVLRLFEEVELLLETDGVAPGVTFDADLGFVTELYRDERCDPVLIAGSVQVKPQ